MQETARFWFPWTRTISCLAKNFWLNLAQFKMYIFASHVWCMHLSKFKINIKNLSLTQTSMGGFSSDSGAGSSFVSSLVSPLVSSLGSSLVSSLVSSLGSSLDSSLGSSWAAGSGSSGLGVSAVVSSGLGVSSLFCSLGSGSYGKIYKVQSFFILFQISISNTGNYYSRFLVFVIWPSLFENSV